MTDTFAKTSEVDRILRERARRLALPPAEHAPGALRAFVVADLAAERYGLAVEQVLEVLVYTDLTPLPGIRPFWAGLINLRGRLIPVLDLRAALGLAPYPLAQPGRIVVVDAGGLRAGLLVEQVLEVRSLPPSEIGPPLPENGPLITGLTPDLLAILDLDSLLKDPRLLVQDD